MGIKHIELEEESPAQISEQGLSNPAVLDVFPETAAEAERVWESTDPSLSGPRPYTCRVPSPYCQLPTFLTSFSEELADRRTSQASKNSVWESARDRMLLWDSWGVSSRPFMYRASCCESRMGVRSQRPSQESQAEVPLLDISLERDFDCLSLKPVEQGRAQWNEHLRGSKETRFHNNCLHFLGTNSEPSS